MSLREYFGETRGTGVLATADAEGVVNAAIYARPHFLGDDTVAFIMADRRSYRNLESNPHAAYLFTAEANGYSGKRLYLTKVGEETDPAKVQSLRRRSTPKLCEAKEGEKRFLVHFRIDGVRPLVGDADEEETP